MNTSRTFGISKVVVSVLVILVIIIGVAAALSINPKPSNSGSTSTPSTVSRSTSAQTSQGALTSNSTLASSTVTGSTSFTTSYLTGTVLTETSLPYTIMPSGNYNLTSGVTVDFYVNDAATLTGCFTASAAVNYFVIIDSAGSNTVVNQGLGVNQHCFNVSLSGQSYYSLAISANSSAYLTVTTAIRVT